MKEQTKQKRGLKKEVNEILSSYYFGYSPTYDEVNGLLEECGNQISKLLSDYYLRWESMKFMRELILKDMYNDYDLISKKEFRLLVIEFIKEYYNSDEFKNSFSISDFIEIEDVNY
jgi:hypothetical protein